ncbi:glucosamine-6-phosphate deaminase [Aneurinibacillus terranovensis]|uniref:glucosamine-6-phosphate deaminase n=1 Tax=Aneurinibacillus terranovensis TaxID=278991 RepID=UPI00040072E3|nr:glucosamine-6-phosphate deaminase [Aneurinibacillus terranovensis]
MKVIIGDSYESISRIGAEHLINTVLEQGSVTLGLATGGTPLGLYREMIKPEIKKKLDVTKITTFNLDEYVGLPPTSPQSYRYYMNQHLFIPLGIPLAQTFLPDGTAKDIQAECMRYESLLEEHGGIDVQILGVGKNGHIGFNEPGTSFSSRTHEVVLSESTRLANERYFDSPTDVPRKAITMGIATIMQAKKIILLASGVNKAQAVYHLLEGDTITNEWPVTSLKKHPNVTVILEHSAASLIH